MEFIDNTGHIFSLESYKEKPIGYEYDERSYIFWIDSTTSKLSVNNYYSRPIYALYLLNNNYSIEELQDDEKSPIQISIYLENSSVFNLIASKELNNYILSNDYTNLNDYIDLGNVDTGETYLKYELTNKDLFIIQTNEDIITDKNLKPVNFTYLLIPIYPIACAKEEGVWISNIMIHIKDENENIEEWCPISVGGEFINEYEELIINGTNIGVSLPKDILKAVYSESLYNDEFNEALYNEKLKEYLINKTIIRHECGNFNSAIASLKWFGYGDKISISKLLKTDNELLNQYLLDYFNIKNDIIESFKIFTASALISLKLMINKELDELYPFDVHNDREESIKYFYGENKPKTLSLLDYYEKIKIGNHDLPIEEDDEKYWYWKPYFDFSFLELGIKLACLKRFYKQYFLPLHLYIHNASLGYRVYANDMKLTTTSGISMSAPLVAINCKDAEVEFSKHNIHYFSKQIHYIDRNFNEFTVNNIEDDKREWFSLNDTCVNIPIKFINSEYNKGYFNCVLILTNKSISNKPLLETHFSFCQSDEYTYKNFILYPKKLNVSIKKDDDTEEYKILSNYFEYWVSDDFVLKILVNNKWYEYKFKTKIHNPTIDFGTLRYRYYLNDHNYLLSKVYNEDSLVHSFIFTDEVDKIHNSEIQLTDVPESLNEYNDYLYNILNLDGDRTFIKTLDLRGFSEDDFMNFYLTENNNKTYDTASNKEKLYQHLDSNYNILSPFTQLSKIYNENDIKKISFNSYMHNHQLVDVNNIDFDIDIYKILAYHLDNNLLYVDGTLLNNEFYQFITYRYDATHDIEIFIHKDLIGKDLIIPTAYFDNNKIMVCAHANTTYILKENVSESDSYSINEVDDEDIKNSIIMHYDISKNAYYVNGEQEYYYIYDKLYNNIDYINEKYVESLNLPNLDKYMNSLHMFDIYTEETVENNVLIFHNDIDLYINGVHFTHDQYKSSNDETITDNSLKINISGTAKNNKISGNTIENKIDSRRLDAYGLHIIGNTGNSNSTENDASKTELILNSIPQEIQSENYNYGLYVKRDYEKYYDPENEPQKIYELDNLFEYDNNEFSYYLSKGNTFIGSMYFNRLSDLQRNNPYNIELEDEYKDAEILYDTDTESENYKSYYFYDLNVHDINDFTKYYKNKLRYQVYFYDTNGNNIEISINDISEENYDHIKINLYYHVPHIVRNRFYLLGDYINYVNENYNNVEFSDFNSDDKTIKMHLNSEEVIINLIKLTDKYVYKDLEGDHYISNQNPSYYWFNIDNNSIKSLQSYLNELERYVYDNDTYNKINTYKNAENFMEHLINRLDSYVEKYNYNNDITGDINNYKYKDDSQEALYHYNNYLSKDLTGKVGKFRLDLKTKNGDSDNIAKLIVEVFDKDGNCIEYSSMKHDDPTKDNNEFELYGDERNVTLYIQLFNLSGDILGDDNDPYWIIPKLYEIQSIDKQLKYDPEEYEEDTLLVSILNKKYMYGNNTSEFVYNLYNDFFDLKFNVYDFYKDIQNNNYTFKLLYSVYKENQNIKLNTYLDYDFYLMHDDKYWYGLYISRQTCDNIQKLSDLKIPKENKEMKFDGKEIEEGQEPTHYILKYNKSSKEYLINRLEFISSNGYNHFKDDDIIAAYINNNDRLQFNPYISSKWTISPMSLGMSVDSKFDSNAEMTILSIPKNDNKYQKGYYKATVKYSLDRDVQHQFKNTSTFLIK